MILGGVGPLILWDHLGDTGKIPTAGAHPEIRGFSSDVCQMRCHLNHPDRIALGHVDGTISVFITGWFICHFSTRSGFISLRILQQFPVHLIVTF